MVHTITTPIISVQPQRAAFTLMELLVVLMIMITIMSIGAGSLLSSGDRNTIVASERLLSSYIKQARQRSIAQGDSVVIHINKDDNTISGISQVHFIEEHFEWSGIDNQTLESEKLDALSSKPSDPPAVPPGDLYLMSLGNSGYGWQNSSYFLTAFKDQYQRPLLSTIHDGYRLSCSIKAPPAHSGPNIIPLLFISPVGASDNRSSAYAGMELWRVPQFIKDIDATNTSGTDVYFIAGYAWILIGWTQKTTLPTWPNNSSLRSSWDFLKNTNAYACDWPSINQAGIDDSVPYVGDHWAHVSMHFDGGNVSLYRDGQELDYLENVSSDMPLDTEIQVSIGHATYPASPTDIRKISSAVIDDVALIRTGSGRSSEFNSALQAKSDYQIIAHNGEIRCYAVATDNSGTTTYNQTTGLDFTSSGFDDDTTATLENTLTFTIGSDGSVTSDIADNLEAQ